MALASLLMPAEASAQVLTPTSGPAATPGYDRIFNADTRFDSYRCLLFVNANSGTKAEIWNGCQSYPQQDQHWLFSEIGFTRTYLIMNRASRKCLDIANSSNNTIATQQVCSSNDYGQVWLLEFPPSGGFRLINRLSGLCLSGSDTSANAEYAYQYTCLSYYPADQIWWTEDA